MRPEARLAASQAFQRVCEQVLGDFNELGIESPEEFRVYGIPAWVVSGYMPFEVINQFSLVIKGGTVIDEADTVHSAVQVLELQVNEGDATEHSFMITPLPGHFVHGGMNIPQFFSWIFAGLGHSGPGAGGTGSRIHDLALEKIREAGRMVKHRVAELQVNPFDEVFRELGPIVSVRYPDQLDAASVRPYG